MGQILRSIERISSLFIIPHKNRRSVNNKLVV